ncbi:MAG: alanine/glycine:cation symporter family protein [Candidatus Cryptobacteroides sp.]
MTFLNSLNDLLWSYVITVVLVGAAVYFTIRGKGVQFRYLGDALRIIMGKDRNPQRQVDGNTRKISSFKAFAVSLASRVGTGNLAGVASAMYVGGPGAVFWMWVMALLGGATSFVESTLAQLYKKRGKEAFYGGPAYYMETGLGKRWMGILFSVFMILSFGLAQTLLQAQTIISSIHDSFSLNPLMLGIFMGVLLLVIVVGGVHRISNVVAYMVPFMALGYLLIALYVMVGHIGELPGMFSHIFRSAFGMEQLSGGMLGAAIQQGVKRGLFSNEAGEGSAPNAAAIADTSHPVKQGLVQALGVFVDTLLICSCTAFIILLSGQLDCGEDGIILTSRSLEAVLGPWGRIFLTAAIFLFAYSTIIGNYYYGETNMRFIFGNFSRKAENTAIVIYRIACSAMVVASAFITLRTAWALVDLSMGLLTLINVSAILMLGGKAFALLSDYSAQRKAGIKDPVFNKGGFKHEDPSKLEGWE